eukprot:517841_1
MNYRKTVPSSYTGSEEDKSARFAWKIESKLEIYSRSETRWFDGKIVDRFIDSEGEWLRIIYGKKTKSVQRFCADIRPLLFTPTNDHDINESSKNDNYNNYNNAYNQEDTKQSFDRKSTISSIP